MRLAGSALPAPKFSVERGRAIYEGLKLLALEVAPGSELPVTVLAQLSHLLLDPASTDADTARQALTLAFSSAKVRLDEMRSREGKALEADLRATPRPAHAAERRGHGAKPGGRGGVADASQRAPGAAARRGARSRREAPRDRGRAARRSRRRGRRGRATRKPFLQFELLLGSREPVGRKLEFLLQEMAREANTIGSKSQDAKLAHLVVSMKAEVERIREQVQNVE